MYKEQNIALANLPQPPNNTQERINNIEKLSMDLENNFNDNFSNQAHGDGNQANRSRTWYPQLKTNTTVWKKVIPNSNKLFICFGDFDFLAHFFC